PLSWDMGHKIKISQLAAERGAQCPCNIKGLGRTQKNSTDTESTYPTYFYFHCLPHILRPPLFSMAGNFDSLKFHI
ncbi:hypothetical protein, partial [Morganella morganii]|uniref:hypothetical protein n=1 Tax=Morganella morganii TaxID=582 RepID=UPI001BD6AD3E